MTKVITYGDHSLDFDTLPEKSLMAMLSRGVTHYLGSEQASKVGPNSSWFGKFEKDNKRKPTEDELKAQKAANLAKAIEALVAGNVGSTRGPKTDPIEAEMERIAQREVWDILAGMDMCKKNKRPKDDDTFEFPDVTYTFAEMVDRRIDAEVLPEHEARIRKEATKKVEAELKKREKAREAAADAKSKAGGEKVAASAAGL